MGQGDGNNPNELYLDWNQYESKTVDLAEKLRPRRPNIDRLVIPQLGAAFVGLIVGRRLRFRANHVLSAGITTYPPGSTKAGEMEIGQLPTRKDVEGLRCLLVDDCLDSGRTFTWLTRYLIEEAGAASVQTGVVYYKPTCSKTGFVPDVHVATTADWIVFPDGPHEDAGAEFADLAAADPVTSLAR